MKTFNALSLVAVSTFGATSPALAQDAAEVPAIGGLYVGVSGGYLETKEDSSGQVTFDRGNNGSFGEVVTTSAGANAFSPGFCGGSARGTRPADGCREDDSSWQYGARVGYDARLSSVLVVGGVIEGQKVGLDDSSTAFSTTPANYVFNRHVDYTVAARARVGVAIGQGLAYLTGGLAAAKMDNTFSSSNTVNSFTQNNSDDWAKGYQFGGGAEIGLMRNISFGVEYLYNTFKDDDYSVTVGTGTAGATNAFVLAGGVTMTPVRDKVKYHNLNLVLNFRF